MKNLYSIFFHFSDHTQGIGQYETESAREALSQYIQTHESLGGYNRKMLLKAAQSGSLGQFFGDRGIWVIGFDFKEGEKIQWFDNNPVIGGYIVQTDMNAPQREK